MTAKRRPVGGGGASPSRSSGGPEIADDEQAARPDRAGGPQSDEPWGTVGGVDQDAPWGVGEDSPLDEGSELTAVSEGQRGEQRAAPGADGEKSGPSGRHGFGSVEPTRVPEAGPGGAPDPAPARRPFPDPNPTEDLPDNPLERQTGMRPES